MITQQIFCSDSKEKSKALHTSKSRENSAPGNQLSKKLAKGSSLDMKHKKRVYKNETKQ